MPIRHLISALLLVAIVACRALAGGGPENVAIVVNIRNPGSIAIANHYLQLRKISPLNVISIDFGGSLETIKASEFQKTILQPVIATLAQRGIAGQIDYVVYSAGFPYAIDFQDFGDPKTLPTNFRAQFFPVGSITGMTYLWQMTVGNSPDLVFPKINQYMRGSGDATRESTSRAFRSWYGWGREGVRLDDGGQHYLLSTMLGYTGGRGNTVPEIITYLKRSAAADGTKPKGTIYYVRNTDVRSKARHDHYAEAVRDLSRLGVTAQIVEGRTTQSKQDVMGTMLGVADFNWKESGNTIKPGAICDHLTSFGGILRGGAGQTPMTEFLRNGAAGASGTVYEPYSNIDKFPHPQIHVHYARGCTLAEAFYQSVFGPYQLLIVGDPLCRPWADIPEVKLPNILRGDVVKGTIQLAPTASFKRTDVKLDHWELFVDGLRLARIRPGSPISIDTTTLPDGFHEVRLVAIDSTPIENQGRLITSIVVNNHDHKVDILGPTRRDLRAGEPLVLKLKATAAKQIAITHQHRVVGQLMAAEGEITVDTAKLGTGPTTLLAVAIDQEPGKEAKVIATSRPLDVTIADGP